MTKKVKLAVFDRDLKARTFKAFPISDDGNRIQVRQGGKRHFKPTFDNDSFIDLPRPWYKFGGWDRIYFARNLSKSCVRFRKTPNRLSLKIQTVADLEELIKAASGEHPNPEALFQLNEILSILDTAGDEDFLSPDPELVMEAAETKLLEGMGRDKKETPTLIFVLMGLIILLQLVMMNTLGVF